MPVRRPGDGHRARGHPGAGSGQARSVEAFRKEAQVGEAGKEAQHERGVLLAGMEAHDLGRC